MANAADPAPAEALSKRERLVNAWLAADGDATVTDVADLAGASRSYASQVRQSLEDEDGLADERVEEMTDEDLIATYERRLGDEGEGTAAEQGERKATAPDADGDGASDDALGNDGAAASSTDGGDGLRGDSEDRPDPLEPWSRADTDRQIPTPPRRQPPGPPQPTPTAAPSADGRGQPRLSRDGEDADEGLYVPAGVLREIDETLAVIEDEASFEVENVPPQHHQRQVALAKLYVAQRARNLLEDARDEAVPAEEA